MKVFDVWAEWCAPCKRFAPIFAKVAEEFPDIEFVKINADKDIDFLNQFNIQSIPTILVLDESDRVLFQHAGILPEETFRIFVSTLFLQSHK